MYLVIKKEKSEHLKHKVRKLKELACDVFEELAEAYSENQESESRERTRHYDDDDIYEPRKHYIDNDGYSHDEARGRSGRGRY